MARPLDGIGLLAYCRRYSFSRETQDLLAHNRSSPPSRTPGARRGNMGKIQQMDENSHRLF